MCVHAYTPEPKISLHGGGPDRHIKHGSFINISCEIEGYPKPVGYVMWYKDDKVRQMSHDVM